jgi:hypothetical protein
MGLHIEQAQFENGEQPAWAGPNNEHISFDWFSHIQSIRIPLLPAAPGRTLAMFRQGLAARAHDRNLQYQLPAAMIVPGARG